MRTRFSHMTLPLACLGMCCLIMSTTLTSCSSVQEARIFVAEADSLWLSGTPCSDSTALASAAATLEPLRLFYPTDYAHANYHYGRLLRNLGHHPEAMQAFLRVTHSRTNDHAIKGRAWSNIGTICNWAGEFALSCEMYEKSASQFYQAHDTALYYYAQNAKALQLAELGRHDATLALLDSVITECSDSAILTKIWETKAFLYVNTEQYDSALYAISMLHAARYSEPSIYVKRAQAFWYLEQYDSALYYAQYVMSLPQASARDKYNMLYILTYNDSSIDEQQVRERSEERADIDKEILDPLSLQLSQAVQLLGQDLTRKPDWRWLYAVVGTSLVIGLIIFVSVKHKRRKHLLLSQQIREKERQHVLLEEQNQTLYLQQTQLAEKRLAEIDSFCKSITEENLKIELCWKDFNQMCAIVNRRMYGFVDKLKSRGITSETEIRICVVVLIGNFSTKQMVDIVSNSYDSFKTTKSLASRKLNTTGKNLRLTLLNLAIGG